MSETGRRGLPGIFCVEGAWDEDLRKRMSVRPLLELLEHLGVATYIHRDAATKEEMRYYLGRWALKRYANYGLLYIAAHGDEGSLDLGKDVVTLAELAEWLDGKARGRVIYFGSCSTVQVDDKELVTFAKQTGASAVVGFRQEVDWLEAAAFEVHLLERLVRGNRTDAFLRHLKRDHGPVAERLGLTVATKTKVL